MPPKGLQAFHPSGTGCWGFRLCLQALRLNQNESTINADECCICSDFKVSLPQRTDFEFYFDCGSSGCCNRWSRRSRIVTRLRHRYGRVSDRTTLDNNGAPHRGNTRRSSSILSTTPTKSPSPPHLERFQQEKSSLLTLQVNFRCEILDFRLNPNLKSAICNLQSDVRF